MKYQNQNTHFYEMSPFYNKRLFIGNASYYITFMNDLLEPMLFFSFCTFIYNAFVVVFILFKREPKMHTFESNCESIPYVSMNT